MLKRLRKTLVFLHLRSLPYISHSLPITCSQLITMLLSTNTIQAINATKRDLFHPPLSSVTSFLHLYPHTLPPLLEQKTFVPLRPTTAPVCKPIPSQGHCFCDYPLSLLHKFVLLCTISLSMTMMLRLCPSIKNPFLDRTSFSN